MKSRNIVVVHDRVWEEVLASSASVPDQLAKLERIVADLEMAIPAGTVARQFNLKASLVTAERAPRRRRLSLLSGRSRERQEGAGSSEDQAIFSTGTTCSSSTVVDGASNRGTAGRRASRAEGVANLSTDSISLPGLPRDSVDSAKDGVGSGKGVTEMLMGYGWLPSSTQLESHGIESSLER